MVFKDWLRGLFYINRLKGILFFSSLELKSTNTKKGSKMRVWFLMLSLKIVAIFLLYIHIFWSRAILVWKERWKKCVYKQSRYHLTAKVHHWSLRWGNIMIGKVLGLQNMLLGSLWLEKKASEEFKIGRPLRGSNLQYQPILGNFRMARFENSES